LTKIQGVEVRDLEFLSFSNINEDRIELLQEYDKEYIEDKNISFKNILYTYLAVIAVLLIFLPKIVVANKIYVKSISIHKMERELEFLKVQKRTIEGALQEKKYKSAILK